MTVASVKENLQSDGKPRVAYAGAEIVEVSKFPRMLELYQSQVERALPAHLKSNVNRYTRLALSEFRNNTKLAECDPLSVYAAVIMASQMGWEIGGILGQCYLVPYGGEAQLIPGWRGLVELVHRAGRAVAWTGCVFAGDDFEYQLGDSPYVRHIPRDEDDPDKIIAAYSIGKIRGMEHYPICEVWPKDKLVRHRDRYNKVGRKHYSFENMEMYVRKVVLLQNIKYLPVSAEMNTALVLDSAYEMGQRQSLSISAAAEGIALPSGPAEKHVERVREPVAETATPAETPSAPPEQSTPSAAVKAEKPVVEKVKEAPKATPKPETPKESSPTKTETKAAPKEVKAEAPQPVKTLPSEEPPDWAKEPPVGSPNKPEPEEDKTPPAAKAAAASVGTATAPKTRIKTPHKEIRKVAFPEFIDRVSEEDAWTSEQYERLKAQGERLELNEAGLEKTSMDWLGQPLAVLNRETMEALITVITEFRPEKK
jgi:recombination protein RecT